MQRYLLVIVILPDPSIKTKNKYGKYGHLMRKKQCLWVIISLHDFPTKGLLTVWVLRYGDSDRLGGILHML